jgi:hypothetical protein
MIVFVIYCFGVITREFKGDAPISADVHGPYTFAISAQPMQPKPWQIHILWLGGGMKPAEDQAEFLYMVWPDSGIAARLKESGQSFVIETPDHKSKCNQKRFGCQWI